MRVSDSLWIRVGEIISELNDSSIAKSEPKIRFLNSSVIVRVEEFDITQRVLDDFSTEIPSLKERDNIDVSNRDRDGFRIIVREKEPDA